MSIPKKTKLLKYIFESRRRTLTPKSVALFLFPNVSAHQSRSDVLYKIPKPHHYFGPLESESLAVRSRHQWFLKLPRWLQHAEKFGNDYSLTSLPNCGPWMLFEITVPGPTPDLLSSCHFHKNPRWSVGTLKHKTQRSTAEQAAPPNLVQSLILL